VTNITLRLPDATDAVQGRASVGRVSKEIIRAIRRECGRGASSLPGWTLARTPTASTRKREAATERSEI